MIARRNCRACSTSESEPATIALCAIFFLPVLWRPLRAFSAATGTHAGHGGLFVEVSFSRAIRE
jgi:hypothetical protein